MYKPLTQNIRVGDKELEMVEEVMLEIPLEWNEVPNLIMEDEEELMITEMDNKQKRDEVARGCRKRWKEDDICLEKREHSPTEPRKILLRGLG